MYSNSALSDSTMLTSLTRSASALGHSAGCLGEYL